MMDENRDNPLSADIAAAFGWWREAGVDCDFRDEPQNWLCADIRLQTQVTAAPEPDAKAPVQSDTPLPPALGGDRGDWPTDLPGFSAWWMTEPSLDGGMTSGRVPPRGSARAAAMVLVAEPEPQDRERLLSGAHGALLEAMLRAMAIDPAHAYIASALPRNTPLADWAGLKAAGLGDILAHHVLLAAPQRLIVMGSNVLSLLGHDPANSADNLHRFNHEGSNLPLFAAMELPALLARPRAKAVIWQRWLEQAG